jgi:MFS family permease
MIVWGGSSLFLSDRLVMRFGTKPPLIAGLALMAIGLLLLVRTPVDGDFLVDVLPATLAVGLGAGIGFNPILLSAMSGVAPTEAGLASGVVNTAFMMGGALGLAVLASVAAARTDSLEASGESAVAALNGGYHVAYVLGAIFVVASAVVAALLLRPEPIGAHDAHGKPVGDPATEGAA